MCAVRSTVGVRHERRKSAESIIRVRKHARSTPDEARQRRVYNAIRVDSVPSCSWAPRVRAHEFSVRCTQCKATLKLVMNVVGEL